MATGGTRQRSVAFLLPPEPLRSLDEWLATDVGGLGLRRAQELGPAGTIAEVARSGLRGRGGGGFPTGRKWQGVVDAPGTHRYVVCNAAEGEPGTFKDRALLRLNPYQLVEGLMIAAFAVGATEAFVALKGSFEAERVAVTRAIEEMQSAGICRDCPVTVVAGPDEYLFGEEKALLEVIEGKPPLPRLFPPYQHGLFATAPQSGWQSTEPEEGHHGRHESNPTLVNNAETLSNVGHILARGAGWFRAMGTDESPGTLVCTVTGDVVREGVGEHEMGTPLREVLLSIGGGVTAGRGIKAVFSGVANAALTAEHLDVPVAYESFGAAGSGLGAGGFVVFDDTACMVSVARLFSRFLYVESCGQCLPCKLGSGEITGLLERIEACEAGEHEIEELRGWLRKVTDGNRCYLAVEEQVVVSSILDRFPEEFVDHLQGACSRRHDVALPKLVDLHAGRGVYDEAQARKQPDWTYAPAPSAG